MERNKAKEAGRRKYIREKANALKDKPPRKAPTKEAIKQAGRYHAIEAAKKHLTEVQQAIAPDQEQEPYTAVDKVQDYESSMVLSSTGCKVPFIVGSAESTGETAFPLYPFAGSPPHPCRRSMLSN